MTPRYVVQEADRVEIDRQEAKDHLADYLPEYAELWDDALLLFLTNLAEFPGPKSYPVD